MKKSIDKYVDNTLFEVFEYGEGDEIDKWVRFYGYGYWSQGDDKNPCRILEYSNWYAPLKEVVEADFYDYEDFYGSQVLQYCGDCGEKEILEYYEGAKPLASLTADTPCGTYYYTQEV